MCALPTNVAHPEKEPDAKRANQEHGTPLISGKAVEVASDRRGHADRETGRGSPIQRIGEQLDPFVMDQAHLVAACIRSSCAGICGRVDQAPASLP